MTTDRDQWLTEQPSSVTYEWIMDTAKRSPDFATGLRVAAIVCRAQKSADLEPHAQCPPGILAHYLEQLSKGERP